MKSDQLLDRMLAFANSSECPLIDKPRVINAAYNIWARTSNEANPFNFSAVKNEYFKIEDQLTYNYRIQSSSLKKRDYRRCKSKKSKPMERSYKKVIQAIDGETKVFKDIIDAAKHLRIPPSKIRFHIKQKNKDFNLSYEKK